MKRLALALTIAIAMTTATPAIAGGSSDGCYTGYYDDGSTYISCYSSKEKGNSTISKGFYADSWGWSAWRYVFIFIHTLL